MTGGGLAAPDVAAIVGVATAKISWRQTRTAMHSSTAASAATPTDTATNIMLPAMTPATSSPIAASAIDRMTPNRITLELRLGR
jgi:hypothetical protein